MKQLLWCVVVIGGLGCESESPHPADAAADLGPSDLGRIDEGALDRGPQDLGRPDVGADARPADGGLDGAPADLGSPAAPLRPGRLQWTGGAAGRGVVTLEFQAPGVRLRGRLTP